MGFARDFSAAVRSLRKNIGFSCAVVAMLAVGIGATTAMFSVADGVLFAPMPYTNEARLVAITNHGARIGDDISAPDLLDLRRSMKTLDEIGGVYPAPGILTGEGDPQGIGTGHVTANWFSMLGVRAEFGRVFAAGEDAVGAPKVVIISDDLWRTKFGGDRAILGRSITIDGEAKTVVGVASPQTALPYKLGAWIPLTITPDMLAPARRGNRFFEGVARIAPGATLAQARADLKIAGEALHEQYPDAETGLSFDIMPLRTHIVGDAKPALLVLAAAVAFVLLIACANVASLLLLRARQRSTETGIRLALGASPGRVAREMLAESLLYGVAGGALGVAIAEAAVRGIVALRPGGLPLIDDVSVDWRALLFAIAVTLLTSVAFGIAPALFESKTDLLSALTSGTRSTSAGKSSAFLRRTFVVVELALALVLLVGAGLLGESFQRLMSVNLGFRPKGIVTFEMGLPGPNPRAFAQELVDNPSALPGAQSVSAGFGAPFTGPAQNQTAVHIEGDAPEAVDHPNVVIWKSVMPGYFSTLGIPLGHGRAFTSADRADAPKVVIVNDAFVRAYMHGTEPVGRVITGHGEIVGVIGDTKNLSITESPVPQMYESFDQEPIGYLSVLFRSTATPAEVIAAIRKRIATLDKNLPLVGGDSYDDIVRATVGRSRLAWELVTGFSVFSLLLAAAGIYSVVAFAVRQRHREFGIRIALGAQRGEVLNLVLGDAARLTTLGIGIGLVISVAGEFLKRCVQCCTESAPPILRPTLPDVPCSSSRRWSPLGFRR